MLGICKKPPSMPRMKMQSIMRRKMSTNQNQTRCNIKDTKKGYQNWILCIKSLEERLNI